MAGGTAFPGSLRIRALTFLPMPDLLAARAADRTALLLVEGTAMELLALLQGHSRVEVVRPRIRWLLALAEAQAPPRLVAAGGYNSEWNDHEPVQQAGDGKGCERSVEVVCSVQGAAATSTWRRLLPAMGDRRADLALTYDRGRRTLFAVGGRNGEERHSSVEALDLMRWRLAGTGWEPLPPMTLGRSGLVAGVLHGKLVAAGGRSGGGVLQTTEALDLEGAGGWVTLAPMHEAREYAASAVAEGAFWVLGGGPRGGTKTVEVFDPVHGMWQSGPEMQLARWGAGAVWHNGRIFVAGGSTHFPRKQLTTLEVLDPREGRCSLKASALHSDQAIAPLCGAAVSLPRAATSSFAAACTEKPRSRKTLSSGSTCGPWS